MSTNSLSTPGSPATARPCTRAGCPARDGSSWSRRSRSAAARSPCTTGARADSEKPHRAQLAGQHRAQPKSVLLTVRCSRLLADARALAYRTVGIAKSRSNLHRDMGSISGGTAAAKRARSAYACVRLSVRYILNHMVQYSKAHLDGSFAALSDVTRRGVLEQLGRADASITDLAVKFHMTLTGMKKHVGVLEQAGLVITEKVGRVRTCRLGPGRLEEEAAWIERYRRLWEARFDELDHVVEEVDRKSV